MLFGENGVDEKELVIDIKEEETRERSGEGEPLHVAATILVGQTNIGS